MDAKIPLEPCPFCGSDVVLHHGLPEGCYVECTADEGAACPKFIFVGDRREEDVINAWNHRFKCPSLCPRCSD